MLYLFLYFDVQTKGGKGVVIESPKENISQSVYTPKIDENFWKNCFIGGFCPFIIEIQKFQSILKELKIQKHLNN